MQAVCRQIKKKLHAIYLTEVKYTVREVALEMIKFCKLTVVDFKLQTHTQQTSASVNCGLKGIQNILAVPHPQPICHNEAKIIMLIHTLR